MRPILLTPGPLTTSPATRAAMDRDWGSREADFIALTRDLRHRLGVLAGVPKTHVAIPLQGSGTFAVEAAIQTLVPRLGHLLVLINGAYGRRAAEIAVRVGLETSVIDTPEHQAIDTRLVEEMLRNDPSITDVMLIHCETTSGILNPLNEIAACVHRLDRRLLIDAMSSIGAIPINGGITPFTALIGSSNKALEGVPGVGFVIAETDHLARCEGNAVSLSLDLYAQWQGFRTTGQWRFTPPVQVVAALVAALDQLDGEGGVTARHARYRQNCAVLVRGMRELGFDTYIDDQIQAPVIVTFKIPQGGWFAFQPFYDFLHDRGIVIYPGKLTAEPSFRIGCIGAIGEAEIKRVLQATGAFVVQYDPAQAIA